MVTLNRRLALFWMSASGLMLQGCASGVAAPDAVSADRNTDFDFEFGHWKTSLRRLRRPLSGSTEWVDYEGTTDVRPVWGGKANLVELNVAGSAGRIQALSLRLYNPDTRQWSLNFSNAAAGTMTTPVAGGFKNGRGEFFGDDDFGGRPILVRFIIKPVTANECRFEQAFSTDRGKSWEVNWLAVDTRA